jgi:carboxymethylenebutenolidase
MCFDSDSAPPPLGDAHHSCAAIDRAGIKLRSADGTLFAGFIARPASASGVGIVVLPDMRGLFGFYELLAVRLAEAGHTALAIDYFGRTAGSDSRGPGFNHMEHIVRVTRRSIDEDIAAAADYLRGTDRANCTVTLALGFCFGGRQAFFASAARFGFAGVIGFYGMPGRYPNGATGPTQHAAELSAPILGIFGGADAGIAGAELDAFDAALKTAGVEHEFVVYPGAPHSFFDIKYTEHAEACTDAWEQVLRFTDERKGGHGRMVEHQR